MKTRLFLWLLLSLITFRSFSQKCGTDIIHQHKLKTDSIYSRTFEDNKKLIAKAIQFQKAAKIVGSYYGMQSAIYTIPVVFHILHTGGAEGTIYYPSTANVQDAITYLNSVYNGTMSGGEGAGDIGIQFVFATRDPHNNPTSGIDPVNLNGNPDYVNYGVALTTANGIPDDQLKSLAGWDPGLYYNIYVVNKIDGADGHGGGPFIAGYAQYPGVSINTDGAVMLAAVIALPNQKTLPHEIGHALGLAHPFEGGNTTVCPPAGPCGTTGDMVCDTDPVMQPLFVTRTGTNPCTATPFNIETEHNFMNYTDIATLFTVEQKARMQAYMTYPTRASLVSSWARATAYPYTFSNPVGTCTSTSSDSGMLVTVAGLISVKVDNRYFSSGITATDPGYVDKASSPLHLIPLNPGGSYSFSATLLSANREQLAVWIDYNNNGNFESGELLFHMPDIIPAGPFTQVTNSFTVPASAVANRVLRMRVIEEVSTFYNSSYMINNGCYNPVYGQTEDFPVFIASILPAGFKNFKGRRTGDDIYLQWSMSSESNSKQFEIERSADGSVYQKIGTIAGYTRSWEYAYIDQDANSPVYFYRIKQTDLNGKSNYSAVILIHADQTQHHQSARITNPFTNTVDIFLDKSFGSTAIVELIDLNGKIIARRNIPAGQKTLKMDVGNKQLSAGIYILKIKSGAVVIAKKLVKE